MARSPSQHGKPHVAVVGAGAVGLSCALHLLWRGAQVTVIAPEAPDTDDAQAASWRAAGMLGAVSETLHDPPHAHPRALELRLAGHAQWADFHRRLNKAPPLAQGVLVLAREGARAQRLDQVMASAGADLAAARVGASALAALGLPKPDQWRSAWRVEELQVDPAPTRKAMCATFLALGGAWRAGRAVSIASDHVAMAEGVARFDAVVCAAGYASAALRPSLAGLTPASGDVAVIGQAWGPALTIRADDFYLAAPAPDKRILGGVMDLGTHRWSVDHAAVTRLQAAAQAGLGLAPGPFAPVAGVRPMSPDWSPLIGPDNQGVLIASGHARNGWLLAPITGAMIAAYVFDDPIAPLWAAFTPKRFEERR